jgi:hypothetical protein
MVQEVWFRRTGMKSELEKSKLEKSRLERSAAGSR